MNGNLEGYGSAEFKDGHSYEVLRVLCVDSVLLSSFAPSFPSHLPSEGNLGMRLTTLPLHRGWYSVVAASITSISRVFGSFGPVMQIKNHVIAHSIFAGHLDYTFYGHGSCGCGRDIIIMCYYT